MITQHIIPPKAEKIHFSAIGHERTDYYVWEGHVWWYWSALGNDGRAKTYRDACAAAKDWIKAPLSAKPGKRVRL